MQAVEHTEPRARREPRSHGPLDHAAALTGAHAHVVVVSEEHQTHAETHLEKAMVEASHHGARAEAVGVRGDGGEPDRPHGGAHEEGSCATIRERCVGHEAPSQVTEDEEGRQRPLQSHDAPCTGWRNQRGRCWRVGGPQLSVGRNVLVHAKGHLGVVGRHGHHRAHGHAAALGLARLAIQADLHRDRGLDTHTELDPVVRAEIDDHVTALVAHHVACAFGWCLLGARSDGREGEPADQDAGEECVSRMHEVPSCSPQRRYSTPSVGAIPETSPW